MSHILNPSIASGDLCNRLPFRWPTLKPSTPPPPQPIESVEIHRQPEWAALEWQLAVRDLWKAHAFPNRQFQQDLQRLGLMDRCCYFSACEPGEVLRFRFISAPTIRYFGADWARDQLNQPHTTDPNAEYAQIIDREYEAAIEEGRPVFNRLVLNGPPAPTVYTHLLLSWRLPTGERALLACIDHHAA